MKQLMAADLPSRLYTFFLFEGISSPKKRAHWQGQYRSP